jgi:hypothetical protein
MRGGVGDAYPPLRDGRQKNALLVLCAYLPQAHVALDVQRVERNRALARVETDLRAISGLNLSNVASHPAPISMV